MTAAGPRRPEAACGRRLTHCGHRDEWWWAAPPRPAHPPQRPPLPPTAHRLWSPATHPPTHQPQPTAHGHPTHHCTTGHHNDHQHCRFTSSLTPGPPHPGGLVAIQESIPSPPPQYQTGPSTSSSAQGDKTLTGYPSVLVDSR